MCRVRQSHGRPRRRRGHLRRCLLKRRLGDTGIAVQARQGVWGGAAAAKEAALALLAALAAVIAGHKADQPSRCLGARRRAWLCRVLLLQCLQEVADGGGIRGDAKHVLRDGSARGARQAAPLKPGLSCTGIKGGQKGSALGWAPGAMEAGQWLTAPLDGQPLPAEAHMSGAA